MEKTTNKMDCFFIRNNLFSYQERQLSGRETKEFEDHLHSCGECSGIVSDFLSVTSFIDEKKAMETNPFIRTRILQRIESQIEQAREKTNPFFQRILRPVSVLFLLLIAVIIGFSIVKQRDLRFSDKINHQNDIQSMKSGLNIPDFIDEDNTFFDNQ
jgi:predicted anti-sigma-YlaC factor YlaD